MYFVKEIESKEVKDWLLFFEELSKEQGDYLKVYLIFSHEDSYNFAIDKEQLNKLGKELGLKRIALTFVPSFQDKASDIYLTKINPDNRNTIIIYKNRNIIGKYINLNANNLNYSRVSILIDNNHSDYFNLKIDKRKN